VIASRTATATNLFRIAGIDLLHRRFQVWRSPCRGGCSGFNFDEDRPSGLAPRSVIIIWLSRHRHYDLRATVEKIKSWRGSGPSSLW
jgi:hypothetical protein